MNNEIVASAVASFNNAALAQPNFLWAAILALPIFFLVWKFSPEILSGFFQSKKNRQNNFAWIVEAVLIVWMIFDHGNWSSLRDGAGFLPYVDAAALFLLAKDFMARLRDQNPKLPIQWRSIDKKTRKWIKIGALLVSISVVAASTDQSWNFIALQIASVFFGVVSGYHSKFGIASPVKIMTLILLILTIAITMQPEYFRFGQLGHLTITHLLPILIIITLSSAVFVLLYAKPRLFIKDNHYKYIKWFMRLTTLLALILFVLTESVPVLFGLFGSIFITIWLAIRHLNNGTNVSYLVDNLFSMILITFGVMTCLPVITSIGILSWNNNSTIKVYFRNLIKTIL